MIAYRSFLKVLLIVSIVAVASPMLFADPDSGCFSHMLFELVSPTQSSVVGEPIVLQMKLTNTTSSPCEAHRALGFRWRLVELHMVPTGGTEEIRLDQLTALSGGPVRASVLGIRESITAEEQFYGDVAGEELKPGSYHITATLSNLGAQPETVRSAPLVVTIRESSDNLDKEAYGFIRRSGGAYRLFVLGASDTINEFVRYYGDSQYGPWARMAAGRISLSRNDYVGAGEYFAPLAEDKSFPMSHLALAYLTRAKAESGSIADAEKLLAELKGRQVFDSTCVMQAEEHVIRARGRAMPVR